MISRPYAGCHDPNSGVMTLSAVNFGQLFDERDRRLRGSAAGPLGVTQLWRLKQRNRPMARVR
jgi:hypothetical protein